MYQGQFLTQAWKMCKGRLYTRQPQDGWAIKKSTEEKRVCMPRKPGFFKNPIKNKNRGSTAEFF